KIFSVKKLVQNFNETNLELLDDAELKLLQQHLLEMYKDVIQFCNEQGLDVFAVGGTALGAVRHQGFIPWDDDIDLGMLRSDYQKFIFAFEGSFLAEKYILKVPNYSENTPNRFLQLYKKNTVLKTLHNGNHPEWQMLFLDIFPYDAVSDAQWICRCKGLISDSLMLISSCVGLVESKNERAKEIFYSTTVGKINYWLRTIIGTLCSFKSQSEWFNVVDRFVANANEHSQNITSAMGSKHYVGEILPRAVFVPFKEIPFIDIQVKVPGQVEQYLTMLYGDTYMQLPKQKQTHSVIEFKAFE
ncbi:MAG: LicD family protein, partial [Acinetobacter sp.]|nr:LicD family protein [Acinetobacter sp.]